MFLCFRERSTTASQRYGTVKSRMLCRVKLLMQCTNVLMWELNRYRRQTTDNRRQTTDNGRHTYTRFAWAGGTFFTVVLLCQFLVLVGNRFWFYMIMYLEYNTVVVLCQFFGSGRKYFFVLRNFVFMLAPNFVYCKNQVVLYEFSC